MTALARSGPALEQLVAAIPTIGIEVADATDSSVVDLMLDRHKPDVLALVAGAQPTMLPLQDQTWETFSRNWEVDVQIAFHWIRRALVLPLSSGSQLLVMSSGAAIPGSPLSGGYARAKAMQRFLAAYANEESARAGLGITVSTVLPGMTPETVRRTYISIALVAYEWDVKYVMDQVGHADSKMTLDVYAQMQQRAKRDNGAKFDKLIRGAREQADATVQTASDGEFRTGNRTKKPKKAPRGRPARLAATPKTRRFAGHSPIWSLPGSNR